MNLGSLNFFRIISYIEGISYLVVLFVAMPLKYLAGNTIFMKFAGMGHGVLFILFCISLYGVSKKYNIGRKKSIDYLIYSLSPFAFILIENSIKEYKWNSMIKE